MTLTQRVQRIEEMLGLGPSFKKAINEEEALRSFLAGDSKPLERLLAQGYFKSTDSGTHLPSR